jgi:hypothetical protein
VECDVERPDYYFSTWRGPARHFNITKVILFLALAQGVVPHTELRRFIAWNLHLVLSLKTFTHQRVGFLIYQQLPLLVVQTNVKENYFN